MEVFNK